VIVSISDQFVQMQPLRQLIPLHLTLIQAHMGQE